MEKVAWIAFFLTSLVCVDGGMNLGGMNLYVNRTEAKKLLGVSNELWYIRDGVVNQKAAEYNIHVPTNIQCLWFTWFAKSEDTLFYTLEITAATRDVIFKPKATIKKGSKVPERKTDFCMNLTCTGRKEGDVKVLIHLNISDGMFKSIAVLTLKRTKTCRIPEPLVKKIPEITIQAPPTDASKVLSPQDKTKVFYIAVGVACSIIFIMVIAVAAVHVQSAPGAASGKDSMSETASCHSQLLVKSNPNANSQPTSITNISNNGVLNVNAPVVNRDSGEHSDAVVERQDLTDRHPLDHYPYPAYLDHIWRDKRSRFIRSQIQDLSVEKDRISVGELIQEGTFARIYEGVLTGPEDGEDCMAFIKTVSDQASQEQVNLMLLESTQLRGLAHQNILPIMSVCLEEEDGHPLVLFPFMTLGNLKMFLRKSRTPDANSKALTTRDLVNMGIQIATGMQFLSRRRITHRDLATRNCMVDDDFNVKIADCALARDLFSADYSCLGDNENRPVKWMAVESLENNRYTPASDVWSFGVTLWELMTLAQQPYASIDAFEMVNYLRAGYRLSQPLSCPDELFNVMACCWALSEDERPMFTQIIIVLSEFYNTLCNYI